MTERVGLPAPPPATFEEVVAATRATDQAAKQQPQPQQLGRSGNAPPPSPPATFDPGKVQQQPAKWQSQMATLEAEHARIRPNEPPTIMGNHVAQNVPPVVPTAFANQPKPVLLSNYPAWRYHRNKAPNGVLLASAADEAKICTGEGWGNRPIAKEIGMSVPDRLEMLDRIVLALGMIAEDDENDPEDVLARVIGERDSFARQLAKKENGNGPKAK
jgi:hypothetical protein